MAYAAALLLGLALIWLGWAPQPFDPDWLAAGAASICFVLFAAALMRALDAESAPYARVLRAAPGAWMRSVRALRASWDLGLRAGAGDPHLRPALVRMKARAAGQDAQLAFAHAIASVPGAIVMEVENESLLVHVLLESDAQEAALRKLDPSEAA